MLSQSDQREVVALFKTVVEGGYCIGCGVCAAIPGSPIRMALDTRGHFQAIPESTAGNRRANAAVLAACPFSGVGPNEDQLTQELYGADCAYDARIGRYLATYAGFVTESGYREQGSSGGMGTWILTGLLSHGLIDGVLHVHVREPTKDDSRLFHYQLSDSVAKIRAGAKSRYYPVEMSEVIGLVRRRPGRYAVVGLPCFIKGLRLLARADPVIRARIRFTVGIVCGHLKSARFAEMFAWQCGISHENLQSIDFRKKIPGRDANRYAVQVVGLLDGRQVRVVKSTDECYGSNWEHGFFKYRACDYCDDVVGETADVSVGDAWLPQYTKDSGGTNVVIVRHPMIHDLIERGIASGRLQLERISAHAVATSQEAGLRHRREGLAYRLFLKDQVGLWRPRKRVEARSDQLSPRQKMIYRARMLIAAESHVAFEKAMEAGRFAMFEETMAPLVNAYNALHKSPRWRRWAKRFKEFVERVARSQAGRLPR